MNSRSLCVAVLLLAGTAANGQTSAQTEIRKAMDQNFAAIMHKDAAALSSQYTDDYYRISPTGEVSGKSQFIAETVNSDAVITKLDASDVKIRVYGNVAVVTELVTSLVGAQGKTPTEQITRQTAVWLKENGVWKKSVLQITGTALDFVSRMKELGLATLPGKVPAYYSTGQREHAQKLQAAIEDMNTFYQSRLGVQAEVTLALLDARDWKEVTGEAYSLPYVAGNPRVMFMPATTDNPVFGLIAARKEAIPPEQLQAFLSEQHLTFETVEVEFVDLIGFHELGHTLNDAFGIDPKNLWLSEFLANYWSYAFVMERRPEWKQVFDLLGRPSKDRPRDTSLENFERLYDQVDDYGWYEGKFEARVREIYPQLGLKFLRDLKRAFPHTPGMAWKEEPLSTRMKPVELLGQLEKIAPGFQKWAEGF